MDSQLRIAYITTQNREEARKIGSALVEKKLVACVNIIDGMESMYWWKGGVETDNECILIGKTTKAHVDELTNVVQELHSYKVPCVITYQISEEEGNPEYINWLHQSVKPS